MIAANNENGSQHFKSNWVVLSMSQSSTTTTKNEAIIRALCVFYSNDVDPNFDCKLEVYCHKQLDDFTIASTPKKLKKRMNELSTSIGRSVGKRLSGLVGIFSSTTITWGGVSLKNIQVLKVFANFLGFTFGHGRNLTFSEARMTKSVKDNRTRSDAFGCIVVAERRE